MDAYAIGMVLYLLLITVVGLAMYYKVKGSGIQYIVAGHRLPFFLVGTTLLAQSLDANATMGNAGFAYFGGWWAGFQFPLGLALSLVVMGLFFAKPLHRLKLVTLPDFFYRRYSRTVEVMIGLMCVVAFSLLVAGNLAGSAWILATVFGFDYFTALLVICVILFAYTVTGGLWSVVASDIVQIYPAIVGFVAAAIFLLVTYGWGHFAEAIPPGFADLSGLTSMQHGALLNWAGILALATGSIMSIDFQERIYASQDGKTAERACYYGAALTLVVGVAASLLGLMALTFVPGIVDHRIVTTTMALQHLPFVLGLLILGGVVAAGMSTANGILVAVESVLGRNIAQRNVLKIWKGHYTPDDRKALDRKLLWFSRASGIPFIALVLYIATVRPEPGILLVLAVDVLLAGGFVPLTLGLYWKKANTAGALAAIVVGSALRLVLYFTIPPHLAGLDTLIPPVASLLVMVPVSLLTQKQDPPKHEAATYVPTEEEVLSTQY